jgi:enoyl-CoA hydratase
MVESARLDEMAEALSAGGDIEATIRRFAGGAGKPALAALRDDIDETFAGDTVEAIVTALQARGDDWATATAKTILTKSPTSLKIACRQYHEGAVKDFNACMAMEYRIACGCIVGHDFYEGVRAVVVDKDQQPHWKPASLAEVSAADVAGYFDRTPPDGDIADLPAATA